MKELSTNPRVLLCTTYQRFRNDYFDVADEAIPNFPKVSTPRRVSPSLRFIKQNVPEVEILEYPQWNEYIKKLKECWDIVGFSFHNIELDEIVKMIEEARRQGVRELWAGNYGALDDRIPGLVDRIFIGPGEDEIARIFGYRVHKEDIEHPVMVCNVSLVPGRIPILTLGMLYTHFGCPFKCTYCQTTAFNKQCYPVKLESIDRILRYYKKIGVNYLALIDETFGALPEFADRVTELFARYKFNWLCQTRVEVALRNLDVWYERGLRIIAIGVESMNQDTLNAVNKQQKVEEVIEYARRTSEKSHLVRMIYYQIGFPNMTAEETIQDAMGLSTLNFEIATVGVITPHPKTRLWDELDSKYGIIDRTNRHWNNATLVFNHPHISPPEMKELRKKIVVILNKPCSLSRILAKGFLPKNLGYVWRSLVRGPISSMFVNDRKQIFFSRENTKNEN